MKRFSVFFAVNLSLMTLFSVHSVYAYTMKPVEPQQKAGTKSQEETLSGKIVETMNSGGYTYMLLENEGQKTWVAVREMKVNVGQDIDLQPGHQMIDFTSKTLNRTFDKIIFSPGPTTDHIHEAAGVGSKGTKVAPPEKIQVEKASGPNTYTVAELYGKSSALDQKNVTVRGKVVKVSPGILSKNWIHIQDGSGNPDTGNHDIVATTQDLPSVGDTVTVDGTLCKDKDFGSGYKYDVIIEQASIRK
jgi:hypothetical protein